MVRFVVPNSCAHLWNSKNLNYLYIICARLNVMFVLIKTGNLRQEFESLRVQASCQIVGS